MISSLVFQVQKGVEPNFVDPPIWGGTSLKWVGHFLSTFLLFLALFEVLGRYFIDNSHYIGQFGEKNGLFGGENGQFVLFLKLKSPPLPPFGVELP